MSYKFGRWTLGMMVAGLFIYGQAQELAWPPSARDESPRIDHTRKVLSCGASGCSMTVVRSQQELRQALWGAEFGPVPVHERSATMHTAQPSYFGKLVLGGCFGGDLPETVRGNAPALAETVLGESALGGRSDGDAGGLWKSEVVATRMLLRTKDNATENPSCCD